MSDQQNQQVTVRLLPDGDTHRAYLDNLQGQLLYLGLLPVTPPENLLVGSLVEVASPANIYLGVVRSRQAEKMTIAVEHMLDRETLTVLQQVWHGPLDR